MVSRVNKISGNIRNSFLGLIFNLFDQIYPRSTTFVIKYILGLIFNLFDKTKPFIFFLLNLGLGKFLSGYKKI
jgi:hypothetical protein